MTSQVTVLRFGRAGPCLIGVIECFQPNLFNPPLKISVVPSDMKPPATVLLLLLQLFLCQWQAQGAVPDPLWPNREAGMVLRIIKKDGFELEKEPQWMHLHVDTSNPAAQQLVLTIQVQRLLPSSCCCRCASPIRG